MPASPRSGIWRNFIVWIQLKKSVLISLVQRGVWSYLLEIHDPQWVHRPLDHAVNEPPYGLESFVRLEGQESGEVS